MRLSFLESRLFTDRMRAFLDDVTYARFQDELKSNPTRGAVIPGCGGLRKLRLSDPNRGQGKRGGARVVYLYVPEVDLIFFVTIYGKDEKGDLNTEEKKIFRQLADSLGRGLLETKRGRTGQ